MELTDLEKREMAHEFLRMQPGVSEQSFKAYLESVKGDAPDIEKIVYDEGSRTLNLHGEIVTDKMHAEMERYLDTSIGSTSPGEIKAALAKVGDGEYTMEINSPGGHVFAGVEILAMLQDKPPAMTVVTGVAGSMAAVLLLVSEKRMAATEVSTVMFHAPRGVAAGNVVEIKKFLATLQSIENSFGELYERMLPAKAAAEIKSAIAKGDDLYLTAKQAIELEVLGDISVKKSDTDPIDSNVSDSNISKVTAMQFLALQSLQHKASELAKE